MGSLILLVGLYCCFWLAYNSDWTMQSPSLINSLNPSLPPHLEYISHVPHYFVQVVSLARFQYEWSDWSHSLWVSSPWRYGCNT